MPPARLDEVQAFARRIAPERHDAYSERALARSFEEYLPHRRPPLSGFALVDGGGGESSFYALIERRRPFETGELRLREPPPPGPAWEGLLPFERVRFLEDGAVELIAPDGGPARRAIARALIREHYQPRPAGDERTPPASRGKGVRGGLPSVRALVDYCRKMNVVPFQVALLLYASEARYRYELDLAGDQLLGDPRAGRIPATERVVRTSRLSHGLDQFAARGDLPLLGVRVLEILHESHGLTAAALASAFDGLRELVDAALEGLVARHLVVFDAATGRYRPRLDAFLAATDRSVEVGHATGRPNPALRTHVEELIRAADARSVCPLCGQPLAAGTSSILCERCTAEVGAS